MRILLIEGDGDFDVTVFEEMFPDNERIVRELFPENPLETTVHVTFGEDNEYSVKLSVKEFGEVDEEFITFMFDEFVDYDLTKARNFHILGGA